VIALSNSIVALSIAGQNSAEPLFSAERLKKVDFFLFRFSVGETKEK